MNDNDQPKPKNPESPWDQYCKQPTHIDPKELEKLWKWLSDPKTYNDS